VPISAVVIIISLLLAFSKLVRAFLSFSFNVSWAWLITSTPAYVAWRGSSFNSKKLREDEKKRVRKLKLGALKKEVEKRERERSIEEEREREAHKVFEGQGMGMRRRLVGQRMINEDLEMSGAGGGG